MNRKSGSVGSTMMVLQQQFNHQKKLDGIYSRSKSSKNFTLNQSSSFSNLHHKYSKKQRYEDEKHLRTIQKLFENLNKGKTIADRFKDPHDFYAYPALFFRETAKTSTAVLTKRKNPLKKVKSQSPLSQNSVRFSKQKIRQFLPVLSSYEQYDFQEFTDGINKMIISFDIITRKELHLLEQKVTSFLPEKCPSDFREAVTQMFRQIEQEMDE